MKTTLSCEACGGDTTVFKPCMCAATDAPQADGAEPYLTHRFPIQATAALFQLVLSVRDSAAFDVMHSESEASDVAINFAFGSALSAIALSSVKADRPMPSIEHVTKILAYQHKQFIDAVEKARCDIKDQCHKGEGE